MDKIEKLYNAYIPIRIAFIKISPVIGAIFIGLLFFEHSKTIVPDSMILIAGILMILVPAFLELYV